MDQATGYPALTEGLLTEVVRRMLKVGAPHKIVLFGSHAAETRVQIVTWTCSFSKIRSCRGTSVVRAITTRWRVCSRPRIFWYTRPTK